MLKIAVNKFYYYYYYMFGIQAPRCTVPNRWLSFIFFPKTKGQKSTLVNFFKCCCCKNSWVVEQAGARLEATLSRSKSFQGKRGESARFLSNLHCTGGKWVSSLNCSVLGSVGPFCTVEHIPTKSSLSIKKVPVEKESSHSKFFGQLCNSSTWWVTKSQKSVREGVFSVSLDFPSPLIVFGWTPTILQKKALYRRNTLDCRKTSKKNAKPYSRDYLIVPGIAWENGKLQPLSRHDRQPWHLQGYHFHPQAAPSGRCSARQRLLTSSECYSRNKKQ